jgi:hypothetical protein
MQQCLKEASCRLLNKIEARGDRAATKHLVFFRTCQARVSSRYNQPALRKRMKR